MKKRIIFGIGAAALAATMYASASAFAAWKKKIIHRKILTMVITPTPRRVDGTGRLRIRRNGLLPFNKNNLPNANGAAPDLTRIFLAGDVRVTEQVGLTSLHILFVQEHNRWAKRIKRRRPALFRRRHISSGKANRDRRNPDHYL